IKPSDVRRSNAVPSLVERRDSGFPNACSTVFDVDIEPYLVAPERGGVYPPRHRRQGKQPLTSCYVIVKSCTVHLSEQTYKPVFMDRTWPDWDSLQRMRRPG